MKYELKAVKTFRGMEGQGFNANLYRDGKKVALVMDSAHGGCYDYEWTSKDERKIFDDYIETLPPSLEDWMNGKPMKAFDDGVVSDLLNEYYLAKDAKRVIRNGSFFVPSKMELRKYTGSITEAKRQHAKKKYPDCLFFDTMTLEQAMSTLEKIAKANEKPIGNLTQVPVPK